MADVYVAAGSNIEPESNLARALDALEEAFGTLRISPAYRNQAVGFTGDDFVNLVVAFHTDESVVDVKRVLEEIEMLCGRPRTAEKWAARAMDLDILMYDQVVSDDPGLRLPRPDLLRRAYMLKPLADIAPELQHPTQQRPIRELWQSFAGAEHVLAAVTIPRCVRHPRPESAR